MSSSTIRGSAFGPLSMVAGYLFDSVRTFVYLEMFGESPVFFRLTFSLCYVESGSGRAPVLPASFGVAVARTPSGTAMLGFCPFSADEAALSGPSSFFRKRTDARPTLPAIA